MKLQALIKPRSDGTVILRDVYGRAYVFTADEFGDLVCEVEDQALVKRVLAGGRFCPANEEDIEQGEKLVAEVIQQSQMQQGIDDEPEDDDEPVNMAAMPIEAGTPPQRFKPAKKAK